MLKLTLCYARRLGLQLASLYFKFERSGKEVEADTQAADCRDETVLAMDRELLEVTAVISLTMDTMQSGILEVKQLGVPSVSVFFRASEVMPASEQEQGGKLSALLPKGVQVKLNAKLVKGNSRLPYLATTVWVKSKEADITYRVPEDIKPDLLDSYNRFSHDLDKRSSNENLEENKDETEANDKEDEIRQDHTYSKDLNEDNNNEVVGKKKKYKKRKLGAFNSEKETINYEINFEAKILKTSLSSWKCRHCNMEFSSLVKVNMHANRDSCTVEKKKTKPYKDTKCADCGVKYSSRKQLMLHREKVHPVVYECPTCAAKTFKRRRDWQPGLHNH